MNTQRLQYLRALGIDVWERRDLRIETRDSRLETRDSGAETRDSRLETRSEPTNIQVSSDSNPVPSPESRVPSGSDRVTHHASRVPSHSDRVTHHESRVTSPPTTPASLVPVLPITHHPSPITTLDWPSLEAAVKTCTRCDLHRTRKQTVFGVGNRQARVMVIGEAPGADEDAQGEPFVGRAGQLLNSMLKAMGYPRETVFIANVLKSRPPNNRDPLPAEVIACIPFLHRQIELVNPKLILCVGRIAAQNLLDTQTPIGKLRGQVHRLGTARRPVVVTYHPAYLLRSPGEKRRAWEDLLLALETLRTLES